MAYLIGIWNILAVMTYCFAVFIFVYVIYIYSKEENGYWCVEVPVDPKPPSKPGLAMAVKMGSFVFIVSTIFIFLFEWWMESPEIGAIVSAFVLLVYYFPDEIADLSGEAVYGTGEFIEKLSQPSLKTNFGLLLSLMILSYLGACLGYAFHQSRWGIAGGIAFGLWTGWGVWKAELAELRKYGVL
ncbi:MAG: hypothetical protein WC831_05695 [Parcubacteria group bacterium]|jgi:hypothetical protein